MLSKLTAAMLAASFIVLAGCAQNETGNGDGLAQGKQETQAQTTAKPADARAAANSAANTAAAEIGNPAIIEFDTKGIALNSDAQVLLARVAAAAKPSKKIVVRGYCDKRKVGDAKSIALARAGAVKKELVKNGVAANAIRLKYITDQAKNLVRIDIVSETTHAGKAATH
ncbi:MAG TPA: OmpA family protein [Noviherbaspirillum sp.]|uniref:OmpA family protein n=1 Tax=Noviherbaspirillum sp. TaxID=1926288 RepID=UPI002B45F0F0|nr:OmpA family protein [Noviherbaspirillum sp.]HJV86136.1 OmpA family protein [Noviherbaspirillum sp.]